MSAQHVIDCLPPTVLSSLFTQACHSATSSLWEPGMPWKREDARRQTQFVAGMQISLRSSAANGLSDLPEALIPAMRNPATTTDRSYRDFYCRRLFLRAAHTNGLSHLATLSGGSSVQIRLALLARNCRIRMRYPPDSRTRCQSSVQCVRTAQFRRALLGPSVPAGPSAS